PSVKSNNRSLYSGMTFTNWLMEVPSRAKNPNDKITVSDNKMTKLSVIGIFLFRSHVSIGPNKTDKKTDNKNGTKITWETFNPATTITKHAEYSNSEPALLI